MLHIKSNQSSGIFNIIENEGAGNCLFLSLFEFLEQNKAHLKNTAEDAHQIRTKTVEYILSSNAIGFQLNWDRFYDNIRNNLQNRINDLSEYGESEKKDTEIRNSYREYMSTTGKLGTYSELCAAAELFGFSGYVVQVDQMKNYKVYEFGHTDYPEIDHAKPEIFLLFTGDPDEGHFRLLQPLMSPIGFQTGIYKISESNRPTSDGVIHIEHIQSDNNKTRKELPENVQKAVECDVCKKSFLNERGMKTHRNGHAKEANRSTANEMIQRITRSNNAANTNDKEICKTSNKADLDSECSAWQTTFERYENDENVDTVAFDEDISNFQKFLFKANQRLPGPQHPSVKFYRLRQQKKNRKIMSAQQSRSSNPQRTDAKTKQRRRDKYQYDLAQYWYYNQRKKAVQAVMTAGSTKQCKIKMSIMEDHFKTVFGKENTQVLETYPTTETNENIVISEEDIRIQIKKTPLDTSAGPDRILVKTLRQLNVSKSISSIANTMLRSSYVPQGFRKGRMILSDKDGDVHSIKNWRPISIYSVIRRIIERALDSILRAQIKLNCNQRGFVKGVPGCHINARLVNACLSHAKKFRRNCFTAFLDISKAFDKIGHLHISKSLKAKGVSENLHNLIMNLLTNNNVEICMGNETSNLIEIHCGVPQGAPLSPILFNIAIDFLYEEICDPQFADNNGYKLSDQYDALCLSGFADDQAVTSDSETKVIRTIDLVQIIFARIGLKMNPDKSQAIIIRDGLLVADVLNFSDGSVIVRAKPDERIKYLGCSFNSELVFDHTCIEVLNKNLEKLSTSSLLKPDQKLNIINQYVFSTLVYPLQTAPINKIPSYITNGLDIMIRRSVKDIIGLPQRTNDNLFYAPRKLRGLGLFRASWEVNLQHFSIANKLIKVDDGLFQSISKCQEEMESCVQALNVNGDTTKTLRAALRKEAFETWCNLTYQGSGAIHFGNHIASNDFIYNKNSLSSSEWVSAIKLNINYANLNGVPGVSNSSSLCRKCEREKETIAHVSGSCPSSNLLITSRHHSVKHSLGDLLQEKEFDCFYEVYAVDTDGRSRFSDIIAFDRKSRNAYIIDPTIRYETNDRDQDEKVRQEKQAIYEKCIPFYAEKYLASFGIRNWSVRGLWFGSRGCFGQSVIDFFKEFKLDCTKLKVMSEQILVKTIFIINNHIYN